MSDINNLLIQYAEACESGPIIAGDFAESISDEEAKALLEALKTHPTLKNKAVKTLWYCYKRQTFRF